MSKYLPSGHSYEEISEEEKEKLKKKYAFLADGAIKISPGNFLYAKSYLKFAERIFNFEVREKDIFINSVAKSGTNWIAEIVWNLVHNPNLDNPEANLSLDFRYPFFDVDFMFAISSSPKFDPEGDLVKRFQKLCVGKDYNEGLHIQVAEALPDPRLLKGHTPLAFWPSNILDKAKVIYVARDPRDVLVSTYHFYQIIKVTNFVGTLEEFLEDFINAIGSEPYWEHVKLAWDRRHHPNFLLLFYEDLKEDPKKQIQKIDKFIGTNRTDQQINNVVHCTSFNYMKEKGNKPVSFDNTLYNDDSDKGNKFFRKGKAGSWREELPPNLQEKINLWMKKNLTKFDEDFKYKVD